MKKFIPFLLLLLLASCYVHSEGTIKCYNHHICVGDYYTYQTYRVYIVAVTNNRIQIRYSDNRVVWVNAINFEHNVIVVKSNHKTVHVYKNKSEHDNDKEGTKGMKNRNKGKHKGNPHY